MNERKRKRSRDVTRVLRERTDGGTENPTPPLGLTETDMCTQSHTLTKVFRATDTLWRDQTNTDSHPVNTL